MSHVMQKKNMYISIDTYQYLSIQPQATIHLISCSASETVDSRSQSDRRISSYIKATRRPFKPAIICATKRLFERWSTGSFMTLVSVQMATLVREGHFTLV